MKLITIQKNRHCVLIRQQYQGIYLSTKTNIVWIEHERWMFSYEHIFLNKLGLINEKSNTLFWQSICSTKSNDIMKRASLGELEELIMLIIGVIKENAYGVNITIALEKETSRAVDFSTVHTTLKRLEEKGFVRSEMAGATAERGGRRKRYYFITAYGYKALRQSQAIRMRLWSLIPLKTQLNTI